MWALVNGPLQTEVVKEDKTSIQHARDIRTLRMRRNFICVLLRLRLLYVFYLDEDYNTPVNYFADKEDSFRDYEAACRRHLRTA